MKILMFISLVNFRILHRAGVVQNKVVAI